VHMWAVDVHTHGSLVLCIHSLVSSCADKAVLLRCHEGGCAFGSQDGGALRVVQQACEGGHG